MSDAHVEALLGAIDAALAKSDSFALVVELDDAVTMPAALRRKLAVSLDARSAPIRSQCAALAFVARTPAAVGTHTAIRWLAPAACAERVFGSASEADAWAKTRLDSGGVKTG